MKKVTMALMTLFSVACMSQAQARYYRRGYYGGRRHDVGASFSTGLAGGLVAGAATKGSSDSVSRAELEAKRAQDKADQLVQQQQQQIEMQKMREQLAQAAAPATPMYAPMPAASPFGDWMWPLMFFMFVLFILIGLAMYMFRSKRVNH